MYQGGKPSPRENMMITKGYKSVSVRIASVLMLIAGFLGVIPVRADTVIRYVKWDAGGSNTGTSWMNAYTDLQTALAVASSGDEIWVAEGTYEPTSTTDRTISFTLKNGVAIYGGFAGTETLRTQRDFAANVTVLSGEIGVAGIEDNSFHVLTGGGANNTALLDGFTVTAGNADGALPHNHGGGMLNENSTPVLMHVTFEGNSADYGGGLYNYNGSDAALTDVSFHNNSATFHGGGIYNSYSSPTLVNITFSQNHASASAGGLANYYSHPTLTNVTFSGNVAGLYGGGIAQSFSHPTLINVTFSGNSASTQGGGIFNDASHPTIINSILYGDLGGEIRNLSSSPNVSYSIVQGGYAGTGNLNADPLLGALTNNGGFTQTMALGASSPAIDAGDNASCPSTDQRGTARPQGSQCDIGAYEVGELDTTPPTVTSILRTDANHTSAPGVNFTVTFSEPVIDVDPNDFTLNVTGSITGASVTNVAGTGATRTVSVNTGSGNGTLELMVPATVTIKDLAGNSLGSLPFTSGETYMILKAATFDDVKTDFWARLFIERLYSAGITGGCNMSPLQYCPEGIVTRAQMAVFLLRGIHSSSYAPPAIGAGSGFGDVPIDYWSGAWIKQLAAEGITTGCGNGNYCPEHPVTRAQMAVFLLRSKYGTSYTPPSIGAGTGFGDVQPEYWAAAWIKQLVTEGITTGCGNGNYCPEQPVTRAQMAVFLARTFSLP